MNVAQIITILIGLLLISFILWWFFGEQQISTAQAQINNNQQTATVIVNGGYTPETIYLKKNVSGEIAFKMRDSTECLSHLLFEDLGINKDLTKENITKIKIPTDKAQTYKFACGMGMFHGEVVVK